MPLMPKQTRYSAQEEPEGGRRPRPGAGSKPTASMLPLLALGVLLAVAIAAARMYSGGQGDGEPTQEPQGHVPFASVPDEAPPTRATGGRTTRAATTDRAPAGLEAEAVWTRALARAAEGDEALTRAKTAREQGDSTAAQSANRAARDAYDEALTDTAAWFEDLLARYGDTDRQVRQISRTRDGWFQVLTALHKTTGR